VKKLLFFLIIFPLLFLAGCLDKNSSTNSQQELPDIITLRGDEWPEKIYIEETFNFPLIIKVSKEYLNGIVCLASFTSLEWEILGERCAEFKYGENNIYLPKNGIKLKEGYIIIKDTEKVLFDFCYNYTVVYSLEGCISKEKPCSMKITVKQTEKIPLHISEAFIKYDKNLDSYILYLYFRINSNRFGNNVIFYITDKSIEEIKDKGCLLSNILSEERVRLNYELILPDGRKLNGILTNISYFEEEFTGKIDLGQISERNIAYMELKISFTIFERKDFGSVRFIRR